MIKVCLFRKTTVLFLVVIIGVLLSPGYAADWPMWRFDAGRTAASPQELPAELYLQWTRELRRPQSAWPESQDKLQFDASYEPVVMGQTIFVGSMVADSMTAYETETGREKWRFYADGPIRFAPVAYQGKLYFASDDGYIYCLNARDGELLWKFLGGPDVNKVIGNDRLVSMWPARGAPVLYEGKIYFSASIWPFMGIFIYALDAESGDIVWSNSGSGSMFTLQPHNSPAFAGVAPQGYMAAEQNKLLIPGGRSAPACYNRHTGEFEYFWAHGRGYGYQVSVWQQWFFNAGIIHDLTDGRGISGARASVMTKDQGVIALDKEGNLIAYTPDKDAKKAKGLWKIDVKSAANIEKIHIKAGNRVYGSGPGGLIAAIDIPTPLDKRPCISWQRQVEGKVWNMLAADDKLFVVTNEGELYCYGSKKIQPRQYPLQSIALPTTARDRQGQVQKIINKTKITEGYCLLLGLGRGSLLSELSRQTNLHIIALDTDSKKIRVWRQKLDDAGLYGTRVALLPGNILSAKIAAYLANLIVSEDIEGAGLADEAFLEKVYHSLRPYGGTACFEANSQKQQMMKSRILNSRLEKNWITIFDDLFLLHRVGALPESADWTHQYADAANSVISRDKRVKAPLGLLWFGGPSNDKILPRHGHGPTPQVAGGRLFIEGQHILRSIDVYTGRLLWEKDLPEVGYYYRHTSHHPGANEIGSNYVSLDDGIYVVYKNKILWLDPATGKTLKEFQLEENDSPNWGYIGVRGDLLVATASPLNITNRRKRNEPVKVQDLGQMIRVNDDYAAASAKLVVMNRKTGEVIWQRDAKYSFRHNAIAVSSDKIFCMDGMSPGRIDVLEQSGIKMSEKQAIYALDLRTGTEIWKTTENIFGTWLGYSKEYDVVLQAGSRARDRARDEAGKGMVVLQGKDGKEVWKDFETDYSGPCMLYHDKIITQGWARELLTGKRIMRKHPLTGMEVPWSFARHYGCNTAIGSENLLTFRSAAAGYFDLARDSGTGNLGGFRSGCTSNLVPANGVLNAPDYTRTCVCSYQNQSSLALIHMPEAEMWTFNAIKSPAPESLVKQVGINFGAPGDRKANNGTLWIDWPSVGGVSPNLTIETIPEKPATFRFYSSRITGDGLKWIAASGLRGLRTINISLGDPDGREYIVRLHFVEPDDKKPGERVFDVAVQGQTLLKDFDIVKQAGSTNKSVVKEFKAVRIDDQLTISLTPTKAEADNDTIICGVEIVAQ